MNKLGFNKYIGATLVAVTLIVAGCSGEKSADGRKEFSNPIPKIMEELTKGQVIKQIKGYEKDIAKPALKIYDDYLNEYRKLQKAGEKNQEVMRKKLQPQAKAGAAKLRELKAKLDNVEANRITDAYLYYLRLFLDRAAERLECAEKQATATDAKQATNFRNHGWHLEGRLVWEARYGYMLAAGDLLDDPLKFNINQWAVSRIKKGQTYETVMHIFRMPGEWLTTIKVPNGKKVEQHQQAVWMRGDQMVYVEFINGRVNSWKAVKPHNGFLNRK